MDPLTHLTSGVLLGQSVRSRIGKGAVVLSTIAAWIPDLDNFLPGGPEIYLRHHRGLTHSWAGGLVLGLILAAIFVLLRRRQVRFAPAAALCVGGVFIHIFLDLVTSYGTQIWLPFSDARETLNSVFIIDPVFTLALIALAVLTAVRKNPRWALAGLIAVFAYPAFSGGVRMAVTPPLESSLRQAGHSFSKIHLAPDAFAPWFWKVILEDDETYELGSYRVFEDPTEMEFETFQKADREELRALGLSNSLIKTFEWFAAYPVIAAAPEGTEFHVQDLRFLSRHPLLVNRRGGFTLRIFNGADGPDASFD